MTSPLCTPHDRAAPGPRWPGAIAGVCVAGGAAGLVLGAVAPVVGFALVLLPPLWLCSRAERRIERRAAEAQRRENIERALAEVDALTIDARRCSCGLRHSYEQGEYDEQHRLGDAGWQRRTAPPRSADRPRGLPARTP